jgi:phenylacetate-coenzyme A ligase PaaK-like adenylate-forming protein
VIASIPGLSSEYRIITDGRQELDRLKVKVEVKAGVGELKRLKEQAEEELYRRLGVESEVELVPSRSLLRTTFKAQRLISEEG